MGSGCFLHSLPDDDRGDQPWYAQPPTSSDHIGLQEKYERGSHSESDRHGSIFSVPLQVLLFDNAQEVAGEATEHGKLGQLGQTEQHGHKLTPSAHWTFAQGTGRAATTSIWRR